jgi:hypothetical protein
VLPIEQARLPAGAAGADTRWHCCALGGPQAGVRRLRGPRPAAGRAVERAAAPAGGGAGGPRRRAGLGRAGAAAAGRRHVRLAHRGGDAARGSGGRWAAEPAAQLPRSSGQVRAAGVAGQARRGAQGLGCWAAVGCVVAAGCMLLAALCTGPVQLDAAGQTGLPATRPPLQLSAAHEELLGSKRPLSEWRKLERQVEQAAKTMAAAEQFALGERAAADEARAQAQAQAARWVPQQAQAPAAACIGPLLLPLLAGWLPPVRPAHQAATLAARSPPAALPACRAAELEEQIAALQLRQAACTPRPAKDLGIMADMLSPQVGRAAWAARCWAGPLGCTGRAGRAVGACRRAGAGHASVKA